MILKIIEIKTPIFTINRVFVIALFSKNEAPPKRAFYNVFISYNSRDVCIAFIRETIKETGSTSSTRICRGLNSYCAVS